MRSNAVFWKFDLFLVLVVLQVQPCWHGRFDAVPRDPQPRAGPVPRSAFSIHVDEVHSSLGSPGSKSC